VMGSSGDARLERFGVSAERVRAAVGLRRLGHLVVGRQVEDVDLAELAQVVEGWVSRLEDRPVRHRGMGGVGAAALEMWSSEAPVDGEALSHFPDCVVSGVANPLGIGIEVRRDGDDAVAEVSLGPAFEGAPGQAHGGVVAAIFDDVMGYQLSILKVPAFTGRLSVTYRAPTPVGVPLRFRASVVERSERRLEMAATAETDDGAVFAEAAATFVIVPLERMLAATRAASS
jgi:acyl-coenzyme A thioesterase PaaI-like protein